METAVVNVQEFEAEGELENFRSEFSVSENNGEKAKQLSAAIEGIGSSVGELAVNIAGADSLVHLVHQG